MTDVRPSVPHVVVIGGGFGGLEVARRLANKPVEVTLVDKRNFHLFQPLLYQVATGGLSPADIASPLRHILRRAKNVRIWLGEVQDIDPSTKTVHLSDDDLSYDYLVVAAGSSHHYFGNDQWGTIAPGLKTIEDATWIRRKIFLAFEAAEREPDKQLRQAWLTFVIVGGGPTGVELAGTLGEIANDTLRGNFRSIRPEEARIFLIEASPRILPTYAPHLSAAAEKYLIRLGVRPMVSTRVTQVSSDGVEVVQDSGPKSFIPARTVLWAAGVKASFLAERLAEKTGAERDRMGRLVVEPDCSLPGHPEIFVIGDMACYHHGTSSALPALAPVAVQQGRYVARVILARIAGKQIHPFKYRDFGTMATIGRHAAVAQFPHFSLSGWPAWMLWLFAHLMKLVGFENRLLVFIQWAFHYFTFNRRARLITGPSPFPLVRVRKREEQPAIAD